MLEVINLFVSYGEIEALRNINFKLEQDEIVSIIGSNGAGKSTLMKSIMGIVKPKSGKIIYNNTDITNLRTDIIVREGIVYVPEGRDIFPELSVESNLEMGAYCKKLGKAEQKAKYEEMYDMFPRLKERRKQMAGSLSGGEQQMLAVARGLMSDPKVIMFDEPSLGLAPVIVDQIFDVITNINQTRHIPIVLVEQNAYMAMEVSNRCYIIVDGENSMEGMSVDLMGNDVVKKAYLGG